MEENVTGRITAETEGFTAEDAEGRRGLSERRELVESERLAIESGDASMEISLDLCGPLSVLPNQPGGFPYFADEASRAGRGIYLWVVDASGAFKVAYVGCAFGRGGLLTRLRDEVKESLCDSRYQQILDADAYQRGERHVIRDYRDYHVGEIIEGVLASERMRSIMNHSYLFLAGIDGDRNLIESVEKTLIQRLLGDAAYSTPMCRDARCRAFLSNRRATKPQLPVSITVNRNGHSILGIPDLL